MARVPTGESTLARTVRVVEAFGVGDRSLTVSEIARRADLHVATASRLIADLVRHGWLEREGGRVRVGVRLWEVASRASPEMQLREAALPFMEDLHAVVGQHIQLAVLKGEEVLVVERLSAPGATVIYSRVAARLPIHASSAGLVLLAHAPTAVVDAILSAPLKIFTDNTIRTPRQLRTVLDQVRKHDYALCAGHLFADTTGVAVPIRDNDRRVVAAVAAIVPNDESAYARIPLLQAAGRGISRMVCAATRSPL